MDAELKAKWVAALRSGSYKQTHGQLVKHDAYCCLGVWCVINGYTVDEDGELKAPDGSEQFVDQFVEKLKPEVDYGVQDTLASMNDDDHKSFAEIADWIEANVPAESK